MTVQPKVVALWFGVAFTGIGLIVALIGAGLFVMKINPEGARQFALFGLLIFGVGLAMLMTQIFAEKYSVSVMGLTFAGTLAAVYLFMWIAAQFLFKEDALSTVPRDLELSIRCPPTLQIAGESSKRTPLIVFPGDQKDHLAKLRNALDKRGSQKMLRKDLHQSRFPHVDGAILVQALSDDNGGFDFFLPEAIHADHRTKFSVVSAYDSGAFASNDGSDFAPSPPISLIKIHITRRHSDGGAQYPKISAELDFGEISKVCGNA